MFILTSVRDHSVSLRKGIQRNLITMRANRWYNTWNNFLVLMDQSVNWIIEYNYVELGVGSAFLFWLIYNVIESLISNIGIPLLIFFLERSSFSQVFISMISSLGTRGRSWISTGSPWAWRRGSAMSIASLRGETSRQTPGTIPEWTSTRVST